MDAVIVSTCKVVIEKTSNSLIVSLIN